MLLFFLCTYSVYTAIVLVGDHQYTLKKIVLLCNKGWVEQYIHVAVLLVLGGGPSQLCHDYGVMVLH